MLAFFGVERGIDEAPADIWPTGLAPFIRLAAPGSGNKLIVDDGLFGLFLPTVSVQHLNVATSSALTGDRVSAS